MKRLITLGKKLSGKVSHVALANFLMAVGIAFAAAPSKMDGYQPKVPSKLRS